MHCKFTGAIICDVRQMCIGIKGNRLITRVVASHVALSAVDAQILEM